MAKVNIILALETLSIEAPRNYDLYRSFRHYRDFNISRYPQKVLAELSISEVYIARYEAAGGMYDSWGCWGFSPESMQRNFDLGLSPESLGLICKLWGRVDFTDAKLFCKLHAEYGFSTERQFHALCAGYNRVSQMEKYGIKWTKSYWSALKIKNFDEWLAARQTVFVAGQFLYAALHETLREEGGFLIETIREYQHDKRFEIAKCSSVFVKAFRDGIKYHIKYHNRYVSQNKPYGSYVGRPYKTSAFNSVKAFAFSIRTGAGVAGMYARNNAQPTTTEGRVAVVGGKVLICPTEGSRPIPLYTGEIIVINPRLVAGVNIAKVGRTVFAWGQSFMEHIEAPTVREAVARLQSIQKKRGGTLCLNDVRNDVNGTAGYCLEGVKSFAASRMPFLYRLIEPFNSWGEIPASILEAEFTPIPSVFIGYRNPIAA